MCTNPLSEVTPWDLVAEGYVDEVVPVFEKWARDSFDRVSPRPTDRALDLACGPGTVALALASKVQSVEALDFSPAMIAALDQKIWAGRITNVTSRVCDCRRLDYPDEAFDLVFSQFGLMFFTDRQTGFNEAWRVLRSGGRAAIYSWAPVSESEAMTAMMGALYEAFPETQPKGEDQKTIVSGLDNPDVFEAEMTGAGFSDVRIERVRHAFLCNGPRPFWESMVKGSAPVTLMKSRKAPAEWREKEKIAVDWLAAHLGNATRLYSTAFLGTAVK